VNMLARYCSGDLIARGRDACDVALANTFGPSTLESFRAWTDEFVQP